MERGDLKLERLLLETLGSGTWAPGLSIVNSSCTPPVYMGVSFYDQSNSVTYIYEKCSV